MSHQVQTFKVEPEGPPQPTIARVNWAMFSLAVLGLLGVIILLPNKKTRIVGLVVLAGVALGALVLLS